MSKYNSWFAVVRRLLHVSVHAAQDGLMINGKLLYGNQLIDLYHIVTTIFLSFRFNSAFIPCDCSACSATSIE